MFDRIYFPALVFIALIAGTIAFAIDALDSRAPRAEQHVVQLERVVIVAKRDNQPLALAQAASVKTAN